MPSCPDITFFAGHGSQWAGEYCQDMGVSSFEGTPFYGIRRETKREPEAIFEVPLKEDTTVHVPSKKTHQGMVSVFVLGEPQKWKMAGLLLVSFFGATHGGYRVPNKPAPYGFQSSGAEVSVKGCHSPFQPSKMYCPASHAVSTF